MMYEGEGLHCLVSVDADEASAVGGMASVLVRLIQVSLVPLPCLH